MRRLMGGAKIGVSAGLLAALVACGAGSDTTAVAGNSERQSIASDGDSGSSVGNSERRTLRVARRGGQSGMEGSCAPQPTSRPFSPDEVRALIESTRATTLAYRAERAPRVPYTDAPSLPMTVKVELQGEPRVDTEPYEHCVFRIVQDVTVTLSLDEPSLDVVIEASADSISSTFALVQLELGSEVALALGLPRRDVTTFSLVFDESGMKGAFDQGDGCGRAVFPASVRCPEWSTIEVDLDRDRPGLRPKLLSALEELTAVPLTWSDGTRTTLAVSLVDAPAWACSSAWVESFCPENLQTPVSVRALTADGRLDAELHAELSLGVATETSALDAAQPEPYCGSARTAGELEGLNIFASYLGAGGLGPAVIPPLEADTGFMLRVWTTLDGPAADVLMYALEQRDVGLTPPLDATADPAGASCAVFAPSP